MGVACGGLQGRLSVAEVSCWASSVNIANSASSIVVSAPSLKPLTESAKKVCPTGSLSSSKWGTVSPNSVTPSVAVGTLSTSVSLVASVSL